MVVPIGDFGRGEDGDGVDFYRAGVGLEVEGCGASGVGGNEREVDVDAARLGVDFDCVAEGEVAFHTARLGVDGRVPGVHGEMG